MLEELEETRRRRWALWGSLLMSALCVAGGVLLIAFLVVKILGMLR